MWVKRLCKGLDIAVELMQIFAGYPVNDKWRLAAWARKTCAHFSPLYASFDPVIKVRAVTLRSCGNGRRNSKVFIPLSKSGQ